VTHISVMAMDKYTCRRCRLQIAHILFGTANSRVKARHPGATDHVQVLLQSKPRNSFFISPLAVFHPCPLHCIATKCLIYYNLIIIFLLSCLRVFAFIAVKSCVFFILSLIAFNLWYLTCPVLVKLAGHETEIDA
jgi:hypothetical protein